MKPSGHHLSRFLCLIALVVSLSQLTAGQQSKKEFASLNYGFVSPNTRDDLKLEDAIRGMNSAEETTLLSRARNLSCVVKRKISTTRALGSWNDGAEHSIILRAYTDEPTIRYLMARLGRDASQKAVIYFHPETSGGAKIYAIHLPQRRRGFAVIAGILDQTGIAFRTLVRSKQRAIVYVVDTDNKLNTKVREAAKRLRAVLTSETGTASFIGDDANREKGQTIFAQEIQQYEAKHPKLPPPCIN